MRNKAGFTLIEVVIVIVILGILAVTAAPKFLNISSDTYRAKLHELKGSMTEISRIIYGKAVIQGDENDITGRKKVEGIAIWNGYPKAIYVGIGLTIVDFNKNWAFNQDKTGSNSHNGGERVFVATFLKKLDRKDKDDVNKIKATNCYLSYKENNTGGEPIITIIDSGC
ncbi:MSHA biogenesis protein MshA [Photobacterium sp. GB-27]|uniref:prepilin-type N-terminal cleavage/methylation domain-containing protein n=1 Tax=unclassified Photobacterium TaxID=2628852 RepID=UPI000D17A3B0|nr:MULTISPECIES: prepilin-type N-terminal cleavage/methylation domain-containing protein [unclassified Photobacterium]PSV27455.1 MSHA biogenesis protein MshA [Photobacterium sp. GB-56]PSV31234.1 MSHA biogenesis protein MshA [Photobacterium sp. GB-72]PSV34743.1 MSHA biogenesis protein MshA [Photobacterium sp. GB-210]PSV37128.1 MSHA biogenesis protein MshA [Photobacterium sp. GB-27]PSV44675.1 MSHA biogenesis protein MshA [Photobacterium sp. GB-36]